MAEDRLSKRFGRKQKGRKLDDLSRKARSTEDIEAEEELLENTPKTEPIKADQKPKRNAPCPCGSGKKYKNCCGAK